MKKIIGALIVIILITSGCLFESDKPETTGDIQGVIYNADDSQPLAGVTITTEPITSSKITDSNGSFKIEGIEPGDYTLQATKSGFQTNSTTVKVVAGETASADLQLFPVEPALSVSTTNLDFGVSSTSLPFTISNSGEGTLEWTITENSNWMSVNPTSGTITSDQASVAVSVDWTDLAAGNYSESISISSNGGSATIIVSMTVEGPIVVVSNNSLNFGTVTENMTFNITNGGVGTINYNIIFSANWLTVNPSSGSATTETDVINVSVSRNGLNYGNYFETMTVTSNANSVTVDVMMTVQDPNNPQLSAYPANLDFGDNETSMSFYISNSGSGLLTWNLSDDKPWLTYNPESGTTETETDEISVIVDRLGLTPGTYIGTITISSDGGNQNINVTINVPDEPSLSVSPNYLDFGADTNTLTFNVANAGTGDLNWSTSDNQAWITTNPTAGVNFGTVNVNVSRQELAPGDYSGTVTISSNGGTGYVEVDMNIPADEPPTAVQLYEPTDITHNSMTLSWEINSDTDFYAYKLYRGSSPSVNQSSTLITTITNRYSLQYNNTGLNDGTTYYYRIYVEDEAHQTTRSNVVNGTTSTEPGVWGVQSIIDPDIDLYTIDALRDNFVWAAGDSGKVYYYNGTVWEETQTPATEKINDLKIISENDIWMVGNEGVFHFNGSIWAQPAGSPTTTCYCFDYANSNEIWVGSTSGSIWYYNGSAWIESQVSGDRIDDIQINTESDGAVVDWNGKVYIYNGYSWSLLCEASGYYYCLEYLSTNDIWLGECYYGRIAHWDGNMFNYFSSNIYDIFDIGFINSDLVWFVGENGYIYYWDGSEITSVESSTNNDINSVIMISSSDGWAAGDGGVVLRYH